MRPAAILNSSPPRTLSATMFLEHRDIYYNQGIIECGFSLSLKWAICAFATDSDLVAFKAKQILVYEMENDAATPASLLTCVILGWRDYGSERASFYSSNGNRLYSYFGLDRDLLDYHLSPTPLKQDEVEIRRFVAYTFFIFDR
jgi:hypothetical protein